MKKYYLLFLLIPILFTGCVSTLDLANMTPEQRYAHAKYLYLDESYDDAIKEFEPLIMQYPGHTLIDSAQYFLGMSHFKRGEYLLAAYEFSRLINNMASSPILPDAQYKLAECYYNLSPNYALDQKYTKKAIQEYQSFIDFFPSNALVSNASAKIQELNDKLALKEFNSAVIYEKLEYYNASLVYFENVVEQFHDTKYAPKALYERINILMMKKRNKEALLDIDRFLDRYPLDEKAADVSAMKSKIKA